MKRKVKPSSILMKVALLTICQERMAIQLKESVVMASITGMLRVAWMLSVPLSILLFLRWECLSLLSTPMCFMRDWPKIYYPKCLWLASLWWTMPAFTNGKIWSQRLIMLDVYWNFFRPIVQTLILSSKNGLRQRPFENASAVMLTPYSRYIWNMTNYNAPAIKSWLWVLPVRSRHW